MNERDDENLPRPNQIASGLDWLLAIVIGACLCMALVSWAEEANPSFAEVTK